MTPAAAVAMLDRQLAKHGEDIVLQRIVGTQNQAVVEVEVRAHVRGYSPEELIAGSGLTQQDVKIILSPTQIEAAQWPGGTPDPTVTDKRVPVRNDRVLRNGRAYAVQASTGFYPDGELVRIELQARGGPG